MHLSAPYDENVHKARINMNWGNDKMEKENDSGP